MLPPGWYPADREELLELLREFELQAARFVEPGRAHSVIVPHAGWTFSGRLAYATLRCLPSNLECVAVVGGHLTAGDTPLAAEEEGFETPLGVIGSAHELREALAARFTLVADHEADNSVEVQLPLLKYFLPDARVAYLRAPPDEQALQLAEALAEFSQRIGGRLAVVGSTDLTHYGAGFGFTTHGPADEAVEWVKQSNDRRVIDPLLRLDARAAIDAAARHRSACSMGAGACAAHYARLLGAGSGRLVGYYTSYDVMPGEVVVGYAGIAFEDPR